jgi:hypothetical protein
MRCDTQQTGIEITQCRRHDVITCEQHVKPVECACMGASQIETRHNTAGSSWLVRHRTLQKRLQADADSNSLWNIK